MSSSEQGREEKFKIGGLGKNQILMIVAVILIAVGAGVYSHWFTADAYVREGNELTLKGKSDEAKKAYDKAIERDPQNVNAYLGRARLHAGWFDEEFFKGMNDYNIVLELSPANCEAHIGRAEMLYCRQNFKEAIEDCNKAIEINPKAWVAYCVRAAAYWALEDYKSATADCEQALKIEPQSVRAREVLAWIYKSQKEYTAAIAHYKQAIEGAATKNYQDNLLIREYATYDAYLGKRGQKELLLDSLYSDRGWCHSLLGERDAAVADAKRGDEVHSHKAGSNLQSFGARCNAEKKYLDAIFYYTEDIKNAKEKEKENDSSSFLDKITDGGKKKTSLYNITKSYEGLSKAYSAQGNIYYHESNYVGAIENYTKAIESDPKNQDAYHNRACCYDALGDYAQAVADYTKAIELKPDYALAYSNRGRTHQRLGNTAQAEADFAKANELERK